MKGTRFSEEQIIGVLREQEAGAKTEEVCRPGPDKVTPAVRRRHRTDRLRRGAGLRLLLDRRASFHRPLFMVLRARGAAVAHHDHDAAQIGGLPAADL